MLTSIVGIIVLATFIAMPENLTFLSLHLLNTGGKLYIAYHFSLLTGFLIPSTRKLVAGKVNCLACF